MKNVLENTKCLVIGAMEKDREGGKATREYMAKELKTCGITLWDHYDNTIITDTNEGDDTLFDQMEKAREERDYDKLASFKTIRFNDLSLIDRCDFVICTIDMDKLSCGTWEELFWANRCKKPIFVHCVQSKQMMPYWMFWTLEHKYFYNSLDDVLDLLFKINSGEVEIDSSRWKLLKPEFR